MDKTTETQGQLHIDKTESFGIMKLNKKRTAFCNEEQKGREYEIFQK